MNIDRILFAQSLEHTLKQHLSPSGVREANQMADIINSLSSTDILTYPPTYHQKRSTKPYINVKMKAI